MEVIQKDETADEDGERDPEVDIGSDHPKQGAGSAVCRMGQHENLGIGLPTPHVILGVRESGVNADLALSLRGLDECSRGFHP